MIRIVVALLGLVTSLSLPACTGLFFLPGKEMVLTPADLDLSYRTVHFPTTEGLTLHGWFLPAKGEHVGTVLFLHGNAENISTHLLNVHWLPDKGFNVFLFDYRGYGRSQGEAGLAGAIQDAQRALRYLVRQETASIGPIAVLGQSLGGALVPYAVVHSPHRERVAAVVLDSAFSGFRRIAREKLAAFWLTWPLQYPLALTVEDKFDPRRHIGALSPIPVLIIHNRGDRTIPVHHARLLYRAAEAPKDLWILPDGRHIQTFTRQEVRTRLVEYLRKQFKVTGEE